MDPHRRPPVIDMTPEGEFRDPVPPPPGGLDRMLARVGGIAILVAVGSLAILVALLAIGILLPLAIGAGAVGAASLWWRARRARRNGEPAPQGVRFVVIRR
jgi:hypothetical protein